jgi:hypothetical protein
MELLTDADIKEDMNFYYGKNFLTELYDRGSHLWEVLKIIRKSFYRNFTLTADNIKSILEIIAVPFCQKYKLNIENVIKVEVKNFELEL